MHLVLGKKSKVTLGDKEIWYQYLLFFKKTLWLSILLVAILLFYTFTKSDSFMLYFYWHIFVLFHRLGSIISVVGKTTVEIIELFEMVPPQG